jgi:hypothetical protein
MNVWLILFIVTLVMSANWLILYLSRKRIVIWLCKRALGHNRADLAEYILLEARTEKWLTEFEEWQLLNSLGLPVDGPEPEQTGSEYSKAVIERIKKFFSFARLERK